MNFKVNAIFTVGKGDNGEEKVVLMQTGRVDLANN